MLNPGLFFRLPVEVIDRIDELRGSTDPRGRGRYVATLVRTMVMEWMTDRVVDEDGKEGGQDAA